MSYSDVQTFKSRFWKHVWELDTESIRDLLKEGNPVGHVNFKFHVPWTFNYTKQTCNGTEAHRDDNGDCLCFPCEQNHAARFVCRHNNESAATIVWDMLIRCDNNDDEIVLSNGVYINNNDSILEEILMILLKHGARVDAVPGHSCYFDSNPKVTVKTLLGLAMTCYYWHGNDDFDNYLWEGTTFEDFLFGGTWDVMKLEHYKTMLHFHRRLFLRFLDTFGLPKELIRVQKSGTTKYSDSVELSASNVLFHCFFETIKNPVAHDVTIWEKFLTLGADPTCLDTDGKTPYEVCTQMKVLWKLRLVNLDPKRWPTVDDFDDISVEELTAMYEGHPLVVELEQDEEPCEDFTILEQMFEATDRFKRELEEAGVSFEPPAKKRKQRKTSTL
jgi:hypothetical protein